VKKFIQFFKRDERGVTALEYAVLAGIIVIAVVSLKSTITGIYTTAFSNISTQVSTATSGT
jgi:pilus assembly protein Flp/PilA